MHPNPTTAEKNVLMVTVASSDNFAPDKGGLLSKIFPHSIACCSCFIGANSFFLYYRRAWDGGAGYDVAFVSE